MSNIVNTEPQIEKIDRFQALQAGQYWRALKDIVAEGIDEGTVLLIQSIRWAEDAPHTIVLRPHPTKIGKDTYLNIPREDGTVSRSWFKYSEHRFLLKDFLAQFEFEPDHQVVRTEELRQIQGKINALQSELMEFQSNPTLIAAVVDDGLRELAEQQQAKDAKTPASTDKQDTVAPAASTQLVSQSRDLATFATGTVADSIGTGITAEGIAALRIAVNKEHQIATIKSEWIQGKTGEIAATIQAMTPFYKEQAAAALAQTEDVRAYVTKLMQGIESLDLYVGKDVEVETICEGEPAPNDAPLTFVQKKLMMDEELAVWADIDEWFDFSKEAKFFDALREHPSLVDQIFPAQRCILVMATTRRYIDYGDKWTNVARNQENEKVFLLIRNGKNIHRVFSPVESHLGTSRLFPSKSDQDKVFSGLDGSQIKFEDVAYTDKVSDHEKFALHYKRFLLLVCGLDHRLKLFGDFYEGPPSMHFVSMAFQERCCRFIHDDSGAGLLPTEQRQPLNEWIEEKNSYLRSGSRVLCKWNELMNPATAPGACKDNQRQSGFERRYDPANGMDTVIAYRDGDSICVEIEVKGYSYSSHCERKFNCKVNVSHFKNGHWEYNDLPYLCLDAVRPEDLDWYIHNRGDRRDHLSYIRFFKEALKFIQQEFAAEKGTRQRMMEALDDGHIASGAEAVEIVNQAVIAWRAANRGKPLPILSSSISAQKEWKSLLDQMYMLAGEGKNRISDVESFVHGLGYEPLRLVLSGGAKLVVYAAPSSEERDDRIEPHAWVHRITVEKGKTKYLEKGRRWALLPKAAASETTIHEWDGAGAWFIEGSAFHSYERKQEIFAVAGKFKEMLAPFSVGMDAATYNSHITDWEFLRDDMLRNSKYVVTPNMAVPIGVVYYPRTKEIRYLCIGTTHPHALLYHLAPDDAARDRIRDLFIKPYGSKAKGLRNFNDAIESKSIWSLLEVGTAQSQSVYGVYFNRDVSCQTVDRKWSVNPLLSHGFENWREDAKKYAIIWLADGVLDENGQLIIDDLLGIKLPEGFDPVSVIEVHVGAHGIVDKKDLPKHTHFFDIYPEGAEVDWLKGVLGMGYSYSTNTYSSPEAARKAIKKSALPENVCPITAIPTADLPDAMYPPQGVERWYAIGKETA